MCRPNLAGDSNENSAVQSGHNGTQQTKVILLKDEGNI